MGVSKHFQISQLEQQIFLGYKNVDGNKLWTEISF